MADAVATVWTLGAAAVTVGKLVKQVHGFVKDVQIVDGTVHEFLSELRTLKNQLETTETSLKQREKLIGQDTVLTKLRSNIESTGKACAETVKRLYEIYQRLDERGSGKIFQSVMKQFKLQLKDEEVAKLRSRLLRHQQALQLSFAGMNK